MYIYAPANNTGTIAATGTINDYSARYKYHTWWIPSVPSHSTGTVAGRRQQPEPHKRGDKNRTRGQEPERLRQRKIKINKRRGNNRGNTHTMPSKQQKRTKNGVMAPCYKTKTKAERKTKENTQTINNKKRNTPKTKNKKQKTKGRSWYEVYTTLCPGREEDRLYKNFIQQRPSYFETERKRYVRKYKKKKKRLGVYNNFQALLTYRYVRKYNKRLGVYNNFQNDAYLPGQKKTSGIYIAGTHIHKRCAQQPKSTSISRTNLVQHAPGMKV